MLVSYNHNRCATLFARKRPYCSSFDQLPEVGVPSAGTFARLAGIENGADFETVALTGN